MMWKECLSYLQQEVSDQEFQTWLQPLKTTLNDQQLLLYAPNQFIAEWVKNRYLDKIIDYFKNVNETPLEILIKVGNIETPETNNSQFKDTDQQQIFEESSENEQHEAIESYLSKNYTFDNFVVGECNKLAYSAAIQLTGDPTTHNNNNYNPFLIYGGTGLGKSHLMHAIGNEFKKNNPFSNVLFITSNKFINSMVSAIQNKTIDDFKNYYRSVDVLLVDDIHFFAKKARTQEEFFHIFNFLLDDNKQIVMTCDIFPKEVEDIEDRLKSRFCWGLSVGVEMPDLETRVAILFEKAKAMNFNLSQEVAFFIASKINSHIRELEGALKRVYINYKMTNTPVSIYSAKEALKDLMSANEKKITLENIKMTVSDYYKIRTNDLLSKSRHRNITRPRQMAMFLSKELTHFSIAEIGDSFGGRDHSTVIHACKKIEELMNQEITYREDYNKIKTRLIGG